MSANTPVPLSAKNAQVRINGVTQFAQKWTAQPETAQLDTSNFESQGFEDQIGGLRKLDIHIEGWSNVGNAAGGNPYDTPLNLQDGQVVSIVLYTNLVGSPAWVCTALIKGTPMTADVHGRVDYTFDAKAKGSFISPTLTTTSTTTTT